MRVIILLCLATAYVAVVRGQCPNCDDPSPEMAAQMEANGKRLNELVARAVFLNNKLAQRKQDRDTAEIESQNMLQRIERRNGGLCNGQFVCGGNTNQCVDNLLVCDGEADCDSGADESDSVCKPPARVGDEWKGQFVFHNCSYHDFGTLTFRLNKFDQKQTMKSLADVSGILFWDDNSVSEVDFLDSLQYDGIYRYYARGATFLINYGGNLYHEKFYFLPGMPNMLHYDVYFANSDKICARAFLLKQ